MEKYKSSFVFVPGGLPLYTYVSRKELGLEQELRKAQDNLCKLVTLTGATKSGKTVLAKRVFPERKTVFEKEVFPEKNRNILNAVWVNGGSISEEDDLWGYILDRLEGFEEFEINGQTSTEKYIAGEIAGELGAFFLKGKGKTATHLTKGITDSTKRKRVLPKKAAAINYLRESKLPLIIDDFHFLKRNFQGNIIRALKPLIFEGQPVILIAIPHRRYDAVIVEKEMTGRLESIYVPPWSIEELLAIPDYGFPLLNISLSESLSRRLAIEAYGSPHLMQEFCLSITKQKNIAETSIKLNSNRLNN